MTNKLKKKKNRKGLILCWGNNPSAWTIANTIQTPGSPSSSKQNWDLLSPSPVSRIFWTPWPQSSSSSTLTITRPHYSFSVTQKLRQTQRQKQRNSWAAVWGLWRILDRHPNFVSMSWDPQNRTPQSQYPIQKHGFIDYKLELGLSSHTPTWRVEEKDPELLGLRILKGKTISKVVQALAFLDWVKIRQG